MGRAFAEHRNGIPDPLCGKRHDLHERDRGAERRRTAVRVRLRTEGRCGKAFGRAGQGRGEPFVSRRDVFRRDLPCAHGV